MQHAEILFIEIAKNNDSVETMVEDLRSLLSSGVITETEYDYLTDNWDNILKREGLVK